MLNNVGSIMTRTPKSKLESDVIFFMKFLLPLIIDESVHFEQLGFNDCPYILLIWNLKGKFLFAESSHLDTIEYRYYLEQMFILKTIGQIVTRTRTPNSGFGWVIYRIQKKHIDSGMECALDVGRCQISECYSSYDLKKTYWNPFQGTWESSGVHTHGQQGFSHHRVFLAYEYVYRQNIQNR